MSLRMMLRVCPKCHKTYSFNPDTGELFCPYCMGTGLLVNNKGKNSNQGTHKNSSM
jgi:uncharacterized Zn finger protein (UPF0148 family)